MNLGLPSWGDLVGELAKRLGYDPDVFAQYGNYLELAEFYEIVEGDLGAIRSWMDRTWHTDESRVDKSAIHQLIVDLDFHLIYTTNYDRWLEIAFERRSQRRIKIANVRDIARQSRDAAPQIIKFHGDFDSDASLVLTEESYLRRMSLDSAMDTKLRNDAIGQTLLFVGYRLSDINVRYLLYKIWRLWEDSEYTAMRPKSYILLSAPNPVQEAIFHKRGIVPIVSDIDDPGEALKTLLQGLRDEV
ncbi:SIR2 family protein [Sorangium sp. So ce1024]|uniref:SIR2 family protein n=1 Tax=Sorangium sp. So ce1024 TaxID=3133327 RepID=UPI003F0CEA7F